MNSSVRNGRSLPRRSTVVADGFHFTEAPHMGSDGLLYIADMYAHEVIQVDLSTGECYSVAYIPGRPSGLGWLPDNRLLVVSMLDQRILSVGLEGKLTIHADLSGVAVGPAHDMFVDVAGRAWVGCFGFDYYGIMSTAPEVDPLFGPGPTPPKGPLLRVDPDGSVFQVADGLGFPNGISQLSDGSLIVAETTTSRLTSFRIADDGGLSRGELWADLGPLADGKGVHPGGICSDGNAVWVTDPMNRRVLLVERGGAVLQQIHTTQPCFAVELSGPNRSKLICCTAENSDPITAQYLRTGRIEAVEVG